MILVRIKPYIVLSVIFSFFFYFFLSFFHSVSVIISVTVFSYAFFSHFIQYRHEINSINLLNATVTSPQQHSNQTVAGAASTTNFSFHLPFMSSSSSSSHNNTWNVINHLSNQFSLAHVVHKSTPSTPTRLANGTCNHLLNNKNNQTYANHNGMNEWSATVTVASDIHRRSDIFHSIQSIIECIERYQFVSYTVIGFIFYTILIYLFFY